jgi:hypothetical protein
MTEEKAPPGVIPVGLQRSRQMANEGENAIPTDLTLADVGLRLLVDDKGTALEFTCSAGTKAVIRINDISGITRHESETLRHWSADQQARRGV